MNKSKFHLRLRECHNAWLGDYPRSWKPTILRMARRRETRTIELIENQESHHMQYGWLFDIDDDNERNIEYDNWCSWLEDQKAKE
jgi:hypothetical protein